MMAPMGNDSSSSRVAKNGYKEMTARMGHGSGCEERVRA